MNAGLATHVDIDSLPWPPGIKGTARAKRFVAAYFGPANRVASEAAAMAGYASPAVRGAQLKRSLSEVIEHVELKLLEAKTCSAQEVLEGIASIARSGQQESNRLKAYELLAKIHGMLSDKLDLTLNRNQLLRDIDQVTSKVTTVTAVALPESHQGQR
jgi:hypothetical protein